MSRSMRSTVRLFALAPVILLGVACVPPDDDTCIETEDADWAEAPLEPCSGTYYCVTVNTGGAIVESSRQCGGCAIAGALLLPAGDVRDADDPSSSADVIWRGDGNDFQLRGYRDEAPSVSCVRTASSSYSAPREDGTSHCTGSPRSCFDHGSGDCKDSVGCWFDNSGPWIEASCQGAPWGCETFRSQTSCERQGCSWQ